jgi:TonB-linked SusC/RagA family outer membrane protein
MMKKTVLSFTAIFFCLLVQSQVRQISGKITSAADNTPVKGATVTNKSTGKITTAAADGTFQIEAANGHNIEVTAIGFTRVTGKVRSAIFNAELQIEQKREEEVVVTAFGVKKQKKSLGYATQEISAKELNREKSTSFINGLQGKVAGVAINQSGGTPGAGASIIIRGIKSLDPNSNNQPLIIIDGLPVNNSTVAGNVLPSAGSNSIGSSEQFSFTNRGMDINPDDIESISILKGAGATALYGLEGANGVIVITTKKGAFGKLAISVNSSVSVDKVLKYPEIQTKYREGFNGRVRFNADGSPNRFQSFGPPVNGDPIYYNFRDFFDNGVRYTNSLSLSQAGDKYGLYASASATNHKGIVPGTKLDRYTVRINPSLKVNDRFSLTSSISFVNSHSIKPSSGDKGVMSALSFYTPTFDVNDYLNPDGSMKVFSPGIIDNPRYVGIKSTLDEKMFRFIGNMGLSYQLKKWLKLDYKFGGDFYSDDHVRIVPGPRFPGDPTVLDIAAGQGGFISTERISYKDINSNLFITATHNFNKNLEGSLMLGNAVQKSTTDYTLTRGEKFALPFFYDISNTSVLFSNASLTRRGLVGVFADAKLAWKNALFLNITGRNDWSSTLPAANRSFFYPGVSLSYVFTDLHSNIRNNILSYGKLRLSASQVGKDAAPYRNGPYFNATSGFPFGTIPGFVLDRELNDPALKPEKTTSYEAGLELKLLQNRLGIDVSYYIQNSKDQIIRVPVSSPSGYDVYTTNAGEIQNKGVELVLNGTILNKRKVRWNAAVNWSANQSNVKSIKQGITEIIFSNSDGRVVNKLVTGGSAGDLYSRKFKRAADGQLLINAAGLPEIDQTFVLAGNAFPDWVGSILNTVSYKDFSLSFLVEYRKGGDVYDVSLRNRIRNGIDITTENRYKQIVFNGVTAAGTKNAVPVYLDDAYYRSENNYNGAAEVLLQDASWLRLRNVSLGYELGKKLLQKTKAIKGASLSLSANNFILWTPFKGYDPEGTSFGSGSNAFGFMGFSIPGTSNFTVGLNLNF